jgi:hypothetical protein
VNYVKGGGKAVNKRFEGTVFPEKSLCNMQETPKNPLLSRSLTGAQG